jgi:hypothetical protein
MCDGGKTKLLLRLSVGMMKLTRGRFSGLDGTMRLWLTAEINSNQLCVGGLCRRNAMSQMKNKIANAIPEVMGMICSSAAGVFPHRKQYEPVAESKHAAKQRDFRQAAGDDHSA